MGGILAILQRRGEPVEAAVVEAMLTACPLRAMNGQDVWLEQGIALAHQHFWVVPEEEGERQPLVDATGRWAITADARIDNRQALLPELDVETAEGSHQSDTALILRAYQKWGTSCVDHLQGDYALAIWDAEQASLFVATDALGARSVSYYVDDNLCVCASEIVQILAHPAVQPRLNEGKVAEFLALLLENDEETFYESIFHLPPAHCLLVTADLVRKWRYWDIDPGAKVRYKTDREYAEHYLELLTEAVRCRMRSSGPVGVSLSGGLDSTGIAALAATLLPEAGLSQTRLKSISYVFDELTSCDERQYIEPVVDRYHLDATYIVCDDRWPLQDLPAWPMDRDTVMADAFAWLPQAVMQGAQQAGCRLLLSGYYGDVLFTGGHYWALDLLRQLRFRQLGLILANHFSEIRWRKSLFDFGLRPLLPRPVTKAYRRLRPRAVELLHPGLHPDLVQRTGLRERYAEQPGRDRFSSPGQWARYRSLTLNLFSQGVGWARKHYARHGLVLEMPYWDRRLVEFVMALPAEQLGRPGRDRWLHRNAMVGLLPEAVCERVDKTTFAPLLEKGLLDKERITVTILLQDPQIVRRKIIRADWLQEQLRNPPFRNPEGTFLWLCISLEHWLSRYW